MNTLIEELKCTISDKMPETPKALMQRLKLWIDVATETDAAKHLISEDGSMNDDLFVLLQLLYVYVKTLNIYAETTSTLCLTSARRNILLILEAELKKSKGVSSDERQY